MRDVFAIDIETCCNVKACAGFGVWHKCEHALLPQTGRIVSIGVYSPDRQEVFRDLVSFQTWLLQRPLMIGQNFKFDMKFLLYNGCEIDLADWVGDTQLLAALYEPKITDEWLADYEVKRKAVIEKVGRDRAWMFRKGSKHSLKTLAPYYLNVEPFWEAEGTESDSYVLKDCRYTYELYEHFMRRLKSFDPFSFYEHYMLPAEKFLLKVEMRGVKLDLPQLEKDRAFAMQEIQEIQSHLRILWSEGFGKWEEKQKQEIKAKYQEKLEAALAKKKVPIQTPSQQRKSVMGSFVMRPFRRLSR